ncbi:hypothetical protein GUJ93_ZPchr0007g5423 [Zizania palustris]|uniref:Gnk2-homologous domain-containing protein n=1 Tax=Zizania palustris TaxID=103762 RepID=A0A8J5T5K5_ZIZPA|nr:hypothetical protein GUJ93_ZPchr0007g5423 [Zizania palustris]
MSVHNSTGDFLASTNNSGGVKLLISGTNITSADVAGYDREVTELLNATVRYAVENSMAQCSSDLSPALCRRCLDDLVSKWWKTLLSFQRDGREGRWRPVLLEV